MSFLDNMPSRNAASFSRLVSGEASARGASRHQRAQQYMALNDTRPPEGQVIGMCLGHSVLGYDWHQQQPQAHAEELRFSQAFPHGGGGGSQGHPRMLASSTPPRPSLPRTPAAAVVDDPHSGNTTFRRGRARIDGGGGGDSERAVAVDGESNNDSPAQEDDHRMGELARSDRSESGDNARGGVRGVCGREDFTSGRSAAATTTTSSNATCLGRRNTRAREEASASVMTAATDVVMDGAACPSTADKKAGDTAAGLTEGVHGEISRPRNGVGGFGFRAVGAWSGKGAGSTTGGERREVRAWSSGEAEKGGEGAAQGAPVVTATRGRVGMRKARRTYGR